MDHYLFIITLKDGSVKLVYINHIDGEWKSNEQTVFYASGIWEIVHLLKEEYPDAIKIVGYLELSERKWEI